MGTWLVLLCAAFSGGLLQSSTGFGYSLICMSAYSLVLPVKQALILQATAATFTIGWYAWRQRKYVNLRLFLVPALFAVFFTWVGMETALAIDEALLRRCLGVVLVLLSLYSLFGNGRIHISKGFVGQAVVGSVSGLLGGLTNMSGPPMVLYLLQVTEDKDEYNGTLQAIFFATTLFKTLVNGLSGRLSLQIWVALPPLLLATVLGSIIGFRLFARMDMSAVKRAVNALMVAVGIYYAFL